MTSQERKKRYNNAQNILNKVEGQQEFYKEIRKEILSIMRNIKRINLNSN
tara:strand:- start:2363 stop:2512 length:150 start_codon:yes stop_codon:yes gene_type:complete